MSNYKDLRIVFMGTPEFAVASLEALVKAKCNIVGVITAADKPAGRGMKMTESAVKKYAVRHHLKVLQPEKLKNLEFLEELRSLNAELQIVVAFRMLPESVWNMPPLGTINLHGSLLPQYRGAAPINWAIINGEKETGATTFFLKHEIDTGSIIFQVREPIGPDDDAGAVYDRLMKKGAELVLKTVRAIEQNNYPSIPQPEADEIKHAPKIFKETCEIKWDQSSDQVKNFVRGLSPYPAAWTMVAGKVFKIFKVSVVKSSDHAESADHVKGSDAFTTDNKNYIHIKTRDGWIALHEIQPEGKKRMTVPEFFRGNKLT